MKLRYRFGLLAALFLAFLVIAPIILLRTLGIQYDWQRHTLVQTGSIIARTAPRGATISLNGVETGQVTPATLSFLLPGEYDLGLVKSGYHTWVKHFSLESGRVVSAGPQNNPIVLFFEHPTETVLSTSTISLVSEGDNRWAVEATTSLAILNLVTQKSVYSAIQDKTSEPVSCSASGTHLFCHVGNNWYMINPDTGQTELLILHSIQPKKIVVLTPVLLGLLDQNSTVFFYDVQKKLATQVTNRAFDIVLGEDSLLALTASQLLSIKPLEGQPQVLADGIGEYNQGELVPADGGRVYAILDDQLVSLIPLRQNIAQGVAYANWNKTDEGLLYGNENGFSLWSARSGSPPDEILRSSVPISHALYSDATKLAIYRQGSQIKVIEAYETPARNTITLIDQADNSIVSFAIDRDLKILFYLLSDGTLVKSEIR